MTPEPAERPLRALIRRGQHRIAMSLGVDEQRRDQTVAAMQENNARRAPGYWIQLSLSMGIATLGLVLGSSAVVIGAMLVSPLMGPILELGMGFAVGSSLLVIRASVRVVLSVVTVVAGAALFTLALPFHEVTTEIAARTAPTALDLLVAIFCALTAAYTIVRPSADSTAAAAGTAIGIALVPPLCTIGFGLGTRSLDVAGGAALLFVANFSAILVFAVLSFLLLGFDQVDAEAVEERFLHGLAGRADLFAARAHSVLRDVFGSRYGLAMRILIPTIFLASVYIPLRRALDEVTWEVRTRDAIRRIVATESPGAVQTSVTVDRHEVALRLLLVGTAERAASLEKALTERIRAAAGVTPVISVITVPDARQLAATAAAETRSNPAPSAVPIDELSSRIGAALIADWPRTAGRVVGWELLVAPRAPATISVRHVGEPLGAPATELLGGALSTRLGVTLRIRDLAIPPEARAVNGGRLTAWVDSALMLLATLAGTDSVMACLRSPAFGNGGTAAERAILARLSDSEGARAGRLRVTARGPWMIQPSLDNCSSVLPAAK